jgi:hypothetical protein
MTALKIAYLCVLALITIWAIIELVIEMSLPVKNIESEEPNFSLIIIWFAVAIGWILFATL